MKTYEFGHGKIALKCRIVNNQGAMMFQELDQTFGVGESLKDKPHSWNTETETHFTFDNIESLEALIGQLEGLRRAMLNSESAG